MNILNLNHVALLVQDVERSRRFYCDVFGMVEVPSGGNCWLRNGAAEIHLLGTSDGSPVLLAYREEDLADGHITHMAFEVANLEEVQRHLTSKGLYPICGPRPRVLGGEQLYIQDPDGYVIELFAR